MIGEATRSLLGHLKVSVSVDVPIEELVAHGLESADVEALRDCLTSPDVGDVIMSLQILCYVLTPSTAAAIREESVARELVLTREQVESVLRASDGNVALSARRLRVHRKTLYARIARYGLLPLTRRQKRDPA